MRLLHMADLHLGKTVNEMNLIEDQRILLEKIVSVVEEHKIQGVILAGDIYDRSIPTKDAVVLFDDFLNEITRMGIKVYAVAGNHDSGERVAFGGEILAKQGVYIEGILKEEITTIEIGEGVVIHLLPFFKPAHVRALYPEEKIETFEDGMKVVLAHHVVDQKKKNILVTHQFVTGTNPVEQSDSEQILSIGGTDAISYKVFEDYDYVALGHIHGPQRVGRDTVRYSGSLMKYSFSEEFHHKSVTVLDIDKKIEVKTIEMKAQRDMRCIKGRLKDLIQKEILESANAEDYLKVTLTDKEELLDPIGTLRSYYPNIMELSLEKNQRGKQGELSVSKIKEKTPMELFDDFLMVTTGEIEEQRHNYMKEMLGEEVEKS